MENITYIYDKKFSYFTGQCNSWKSLDIAHDLVVKEYQNWGDAYTIQFDIKITNLPNNLVTNLPQGWLSIFHISASDNAVSYGDRIPAIFLSKNKKLYFYSAVSGNLLHEQNFDIQLDRMYQIVVQQFKEGEKYWFEIIIDGVSKGKTENTQPETFSKVKFYAGNPWFEPFSSEFGSISNILISKSRF